MDDAHLCDDPDRVRERLHSTPSGEWFVFETFAADGSLAVGAATGEPDPTAVQVVYAGLTRDVAEAAARGLARWRRDRGHRFPAP